MGKRKESEASEPLSCDFGVESVCKRAGPRELWCEDGTDSSSRVSWLCAVLGNEKGGGIAFLTGSARAGGLEAWVLGPGVG